MASERIEQAGQGPVIAPYSANLIGTIKSHLEGLQGYDVMALELIQNADDAKARELSFDVTDAGLWVRNSGRFGYCGDLTVKPCLNVLVDGESCDYHRIIEVASGGKLSRGENIGRFGIGFVSTYQITDHPEIHSSGIRLTLRPELESSLVEEIADEGGTAFFLPWATNPESPARRALGQSHVGVEHIDNIASDIQDVLRRSLLFLRHVTKAEVRRNGRLLLGCDLDRGDGSGLRLTFSPDGQVERWIVLRADAREAARELYETFPRLEELDRDTKISLGLRVEPAPLDNGLIYAFLPTEQPTGLPSHINADFFPEGDRKAVIFAGHRHQNAWNEMLINAAAVELASNPEELAGAIGHIQLWQIFQRASEMSKPQRHPACFESFWRCIKATAPAARIVPAQDGAAYTPGSVLIPPGAAAFSAEQVGALEKLGGRIAIEDLRPYRNALTGLGVQALNFDRLVSLMSEGLAGRTAGTDTVEDEEIKALWEPLWSLVNEMLPEAVSESLQAKQSIQRLMGLPFVVTEDGYLVTLAQSRVAPLHLPGDKVAELLPRMAILSHRLRPFAKICSRVEPLTLPRVVSHLDSQLRSAGGIEDALVSTQKDDLRELYSLFAALDRNSEADQAACETLRRLPIWLSSRGLIRADRALLPGDFTDPTGEADLLDTSALTDTARAFAREKLRVGSQTVKAFVETVLPRFFDEHGPKDPKRYRQLIHELANHPTLIDDESTRGLLASLRIVPTQDGNWAEPENAYWRSDELAKTLGEARQLWVDTSRIPTSRSVTGFLDELGIRKTPAAFHLVERMIGIAEAYPPTEDARRASERAFYALCANYDSSQEDDTQQEAISNLAGAVCFPAEDDAENWHSGGKLYAPFRADAFRSQARILDFKNFGLLTRGLLDELGIKANPETKLVVDHLLHCVERGIEPGVTTYIVLNERANDPQLARLKGERCVWIESHKVFARPNQLYWSPQQLGRYAFTIPGRLETYKPFFDAIDVKNVPEGADYVDILIDIVGEFFERCQRIDGPDRAIYDVCLKGIADADSNGQLDAGSLDRLRKSPSILNSLGLPSYPDEVLLKNSVWHADFFQGELDKALCSLDAGFWPLLEKIGVGCLSDHAQVALDYVDGDRRAEPDFGQCIADRADVLARLLHDKPAKVRAKIREAARQLSAFSYDKVRIQATVRLGEAEMLAPSAQAQAFYDDSLRHLILARPVTDRSWPRALTALFHQLMPEESGSEISKLTMSIRHLMLMPVEEAHLELTEASVPFLDALTEAASSEDLSSPQMEGIGGHDAAAEERPIVDGGGEAPAAAPSGEPAASRQVAPSARAPSAGQDDSAKTGPASAPAGGPGEAPSDGGRDPSGGVYQPRKPGSGGRRGGSRPEHKQQWERRLLSYVKRKVSDESGPDGGEGLSEHNLAVEAVARDAVCSYELERGRAPEQMPQTHPGYDIISSDQLTGECRYIEVKGVSGQWNATGVPVSRIQFSNAQDFGDSYWLYVVEFVGEPEHIRIHPIQNPASKVTAFVFDGGWRDAASDETADPALSFVAGARVLHKSFGVGRIDSVELRGSSRVMLIDFEQSGKRTVTLNLHMMQIARDAHGADAS